MAARKQTAPTSGEFVSREDAERMAQEAAGRVLMTMPEPPEPDPAIPELNEDDPDDVALANVIADLGGPGIDAKVNVYQLDQNRNKSFVRAFMPTEFSLEAVQSEYGPGDYEIHVRKDGRLATRKVIKIAVPKNQPANVAVNSGIESARILETMQNGFKEMGAMFANALAGLAANQPKPKTAMETLQELQMMKEIMGVNNAPAAPAADPLQMVELAMNLAEKIQPRVGEPGASEVIMEAIKNFGPLLQNASQNRPVNSLPQLPVQQHPAIVPPQMPVQTASAEQSPQPIQPTEDDQMNLARKMYLNMLVSNAQANNDPTTYANLMLDLAGEDEALKFANDPQWFEKLCGEEPKATPYKEWFDELRNIVIELTKPENPGIDTENETAPAP